MIKTELTDGLIRLRHYTEDDAEELYKAVRESMNELQVWMPWCHPDYSIEESRTWLAGLPEARESGSQYDFRISDARTDEYLGGVGLNRIDPLHHKANLGYWVKSSATGREVATRATRLVARFAFEELQLVRVEIVAAVENLASQRVAEKAGAVREGIMRKALLINGVAHDAVLTSLIAEDIKKQG